MSVVTSRARVGRVVRAVCLGLRRSRCTIQELMRHANLKITMDTDEKREAQDKLVKMILPGIQRAVI